MTIHREIIELVTFLVAGEVLMENPIPEKHRENGSEERSTQKSGGNSAGCDVNIFFICQ